MCFAVKLQIPWATNQIYWKGSRLNLMQFYTGERQVKILKWEFLQEMICEERDKG